jgi:hypothetical protein
MLSAQGLLRVSAMANLPGTLTSPEVAPVNTASGALLPIDSSKPCSSIRDGARMPLYAMASATAYGAPLLPTQAPKAATLAMSSLFLIAVRTNNERERPLSVRVT